MAVLVLVSSLILEQINTNRRLMADNLHGQEGVDCGNNGSSDQARPVNAEWHSGDS